MAMIYTIDFTGDEIELIQKALELLHRKIDKPESGQNEPDK